MRGRAVAILFAAAVVAGCSGSGQTPEQRTVEDHERGYRFVLPPGWRTFGWEARSSSGSLLTIDVHSLIGADAKFVAGLPQSVVPQLEAWTLYYFSVVDKPVSRGTTVGGASALEVVYPTRIRAQDPPSRAEYWVVRNGSLLYILRATYPGGRADADGPAVRDLLASWKFLEATAPGAKPIGTTPPPRS
jgi:hypothetical protein